MTVENLLLLASYLAKDGVLTANGKAFFKELILRRDHRLHALLERFQLPQVDDAVRPARNLEKSSDPALQCTRGCLTRDVLERAAPPRLPPPRGALQCHRRELLQPAALQHVDGIIVLSKSVRVVLGRRRCRPVLLHGSRRLRCCGLRLLWREQRRVGEPPALLSCEPRVGKRPTH